VESVLAERTKKQTRKRQVLVKWARLDLLSATRDPMENMSQWTPDDFRGLQAEAEEKQTDSDTG